jgi:hypothetical protein
MDIARTAAALLMLVALGTATHASSERTREQVKAGLAEVVRNEDVLGAGDEMSELQALNSTQPDPPTKPLIFPPRLATCDEERYGGAVRL